MWSTYFPHFYHSTHTSWLCLIEWITTSKLRFFFDKQQLRINYKTVILMIRIMCSKKKEWKTADKCLAMILVSLLFDCLCFTWSVNRVWHFIVYHNLKKLYWRLKNSPPWWIPMNETYNTIFKNYYTVESEPESWIDYIYIKFRILQTDYWLYFVMYFECMLFLLLLFKLFVLICFFVFCFWFAWLFN